MDSIFKIYEGIEAFIEKINGDPQAYSDLFTQFQSCDVSKILTDFRQFCIPNFLQSGNMYTKIFSDQMHSWKIDQWYDSLQNIGAIHHTQHSGESRMHSPMVGNFKVGSKRKYNQDPSALPALHDFEKR